MNCTLKLFVVFITLTTTQSIYGQNIKILATGNDNEDINTGIPIISQSNSMEDYQLLDSMIAFRFNSISDSVPLYRYDYLYENGEKDISRAYLRWNSMTDQWDGRDTVIRKYDDKGNIIEDIRISFVSGSWAKQSRYVYDYNDQGKVTLTELYGWDRFKQEWEMDYSNTYAYNDLGQKTQYIRNNPPGYPEKEEYYYDEMGRLVETLEYRGQTTTGEPWVNVSKFSNLYDTTGLLDMSFYDEICYWENEQWQLNSKGTLVKSDTADMLIYTNHYWSLNDSALVNSSKSHFYKVDSKILVAESYKWDKETTKWIPYAKNENFIRVNLNDDYLYAYYNWNESDSSWVGQKKEIYLCDTVNYIVDYIDYEWETNSGKWINNSKRTSGFNTDWDPLTWILYGWDEAKKEWYNKSFAEYLYNEFDNLFCEQFYDWNDSLTQWDISSKGHYYFSTIIQSSVLNNFGTFNIYPNPSVGLINIRSSDNFSSAEIYNMNGTLLESYGMEQVNGTLDLSHLGEGLFIIKLTDVNGLSYCNKILIYR